MNGAVNWYPGHMAKALRQIRSEIEKVDVVLLILDSRIPGSSVNPDIMELTGRKKQIAVLTKKDLADPVATDKWIDYFRGRNINAVSVDSRNRGDLPAIRSLINGSMKEKRERDLKRGIKNRPARVMAAGIPNAGKSTILNTLSGRSSLKTGNKPGVTRGDQWISAGKDTMLLDTPGLLWPRQDRERVSLNLALTGSINDDILDREKLCISLMRFLDERYPKALEDRYGEGLPKDPGEALFEIGRRRGMMLRGSEVDVRASASAVINDLRNGKLGRISLETPDDWTDLDVGEYSS